MEDITKIDNWNYNLPVYGITDLGLFKTGEIHIPLVRGSKDNPIQAGVITEDLLALVIDYLKSVNVGELATRETSTGITNIEQGLMWIQKRRNDREKRGVAQTYQK